MGAVRHTCPVCGYPGLSEPPRSSTTGGGSYEICPSCGFEFGVTDDDEGYEYETWRQKWVNDGMRWSSVSQPQPNDWNPRKLLDQLLGEAGGAA